MPVGDRSPSEPRAHWTRVYETRAATEVSWFQPEATVSLDLIGELSLPADAPILDVGAGASTLVDGLLARGLRDITLLDVTAAALDVVRARIGQRAEVHYVVADVTAWHAPRNFALWHDRAVFHFMVSDEQRADYRRCLEAALVPGAHAIVATFALDGPERCSGLPVRRYSPEGLEHEFAGALKLIGHRRQVHATPAGASQAFTFAVFERTGA